LAAECPREMTLYMIYGTLFLWGTLLPVTFKELLECEGKMHFQPLLLSPCAKMAVKFFLGNFQVCLLIE
jgi:hypothetical protein